MEHLVQEHYACPDLVEKIRAGLEKTGKTPEKISPKELGAVDQLHTGGAAATLSIGERAGLKRGAAVLDAGCGIGGTSRVLAGHFGLAVSGIDLSYDFIDTAKILTQWCGMDQTCDISFRQGSVLELPYETNSFDAIFCQHILLNIKEKTIALSEFSRVLKQGGKLILHEIVEGPGPAPIMPVPWANDSSTSFIEPWEILEKELSDTGFSPTYFSDETQTNADWWKKVNAIKKAKGTSPLNPGLVFGDNARLFGPNMEQNFSAQAVRCIEAIFTIT
ncbi:MAG: class I SAM-dependent methyltransferase [Desulfobacterales bacterium]|nr:class I SAM-dependent methyltransferase [Desulfobacterales bacterium]